jgi:preprotein translocase subunit SecA
MLKFFNKLFDSNEKTLLTYREKVAAVNALEPEYEKLADTELEVKTAEFKHRVKQGKTLDDILPEAYALVREAAKRTLGLRHYDVQLIAGIAFHEGKVAEQKTGEGKTLSATLALYLNALTEKGAHLVTVNDYLAQRDAGWNAPLFHLLGLSTAVIYSGKGDQPAAIYDPEYQGAERGDQRLEHLRPVTRKEAYAADITYGTNNEFGFDYLRDNMAQSIDEMSQRGHHFAIVDEVDSILIDEARTPLIISAPDADATSKYYDFAKLVETLDKDTDYALDEKLRSVTLTDYGLRRLEKRLGVVNLYEKDYDTIHHVEQALKARTVFSRDKDYVVKDDQVIIVDEHTGRLMFGRRYSDGLHQAIEAKEGVAIQQESRTLATVSLQNYFRMYEKLAGMTGTAETEAEEFQEIYGMEVLVVPTNQPIERKDNPDMVYKTQRAKYGAVVKEVRELWEKGAPVLIGTKSIEQNDIMSRYLKRMKVPHQVLNAKNHEQEALIVADAGKPKAVTVATNIAGRGVDIVLGGAKPEKPNAATTSKKEIGAYEKAMEDWRNRHEEVLSVGGLYIIGSERHDSRRIDNQLRGRSGRQGDPGASRFYVSLEDDLMRIFGGERVSKIMDALKIPEDQPIESGMVSKSIESAQSKVEGFHFDQRKRVVEYDDVMNKQREIIYKKRLQILELADDDGDTTQLREKILDAVQKEIRSLVIARSGEGFVSEEYDAILKEFMSIIPFDHDSQAKIRTKIEGFESGESIVEELSSIAEKTYEQRETQMGASQMRQVERYVFLSSIDRMWMNHLDAMDDLREGIWLRGGKDQVLSEYKKEAFDMFGGLLDKINAEVAHNIFRIQVTQMARPTLPEDVVAGKQDNFAKTAGAPETPKPVKSMGSTSALATALGKSAYKSGSGDGRRPTLVQIDPNQKKVGRNDPCPCGAVNPSSGKVYKWKKCGMINAEYHKG